MDALVNLLIIDDDRDLCALLETYLGERGFAVSCVHDAASGLDQLRTNSRPDVLILDVMLPGMDGLEALRLIRVDSQIPVLMLTARGEEIDRIVGLELGADDYLPKPFNPRELTARLHAILRRSKAVTASSSARTLQVSDLTIEPRARVVRCSDRDIALTATEFDVLHLLAQQPGGIVSRDLISESVLQRPYHPDDRSIDVHMGRIRRKLGPLPDGRERIETRRGVGYILLIDGDEGGSR